MIIFAFVLNVLVGAFNVAVLVANPNPVSAFCLGINVVCALSMVVLASDGY